ncbi:hypothetical protein [Photobacterium lipolyticum]|uniref:hypothetical protein n=1 Tax=Photobacterium lipolyticum TaxID=266810 RepID=UPI0014756D14|nr:hypothetical protein [Photobacterium lipolyticum]
MRDSDLGYIREQSIDRLADTIEEQMDLAKLWPGCVRIFLTRNSVIFVWGG